MLNELNVIARGLLGLQGYPVDLPEGAAAQSAAIDGMRRDAPPARDPHVAKVPRPLTLHARGSR